MTPDLERDGYTVLLGTVPQDAIRAALRCIGLGIRRHGLPGGAERARCQGGTFLPELRDEPAIWALFTGGRWPATPGRRASTSDSWERPNDHPLGP